MVACLAVGSQGGYKPKCRTIYETAYTTEYEQSCSTSYKSQCETSYVEQCQTDYETSYEQKVDHTITRFYNLTSPLKCSTSYEEQCSTSYETSYEEKCSTSYKEVLSPPLLKTLLKLPTLETLIDADH